MKGGFHFQNSWPWIATLWSTIGYEKLDALLPEMAGSGSFEFTGAVTLWATYNMMMTTLSNQRWQWKTHSLVRCFYMFLLGSHAWLPEGIANNNRDNPHVLGPLGYNGDTSIIPIMEKILIIGIAGGFSCQPFYGYILRYTMIWMIPSAVVIAMAGKSTRHSDRWPEGIPMRNIPTKWLA